ncbi:hypothetical protein MNEG_14326 [Monoraphidium neglectum]|uniref:FAD-binding FR-type domain-containing protein n=1 Tax=Monoraphidium neglectum TaxID=145388 RepID=A0A0D2MER7_9CHLO|nr:hypothetical protein MNEG_14326 [Monoraphidium neglectum]KIY93635.1 hypothetical protein MNEG_14326 [Monoraphidium neglectum]|eukprot:XP_013892655.1 hypothetical protein MNEG_14326 [Monoraphidium neglectum]
MQLARSARLLAANGRGARNAEPAAFRAAAAPHHGAALPRGAAPFAAAASAAPKASLTQAAGARVSSGRRSTVRVSAGWGDPVTFTPAKVLGVSQAATQLFTVTIDVGPEIAAGYTQGGQYVQIKVGDSKPGFFAIASPPEPNNQGKRSPKRPPPSRRTPSCVLEFLIKAAGETAEKLVTLAPGDSVDVSPVQGKVGRSDDRHWKL